MSKKPNSQKRQSQPAEQKLQSSIEKVQAKVQSEQKDQPEKQKSEVKITNITGMIAAELQQYPVMMIALHRALKSKGFLFRLSWYEVADPVNHPELDLQHHFENSNFAKKDILPVLQHQKLDYIKKHEPDLDVATVQCPHCHKMMPDQRGFI